MIIQHNMISAFANEMLGISNKKISKSTEKLASGYRINRAADDAASLAISEKMRGQIRGLMRAEDNIADGINYIKTADGALNEITNMVQRMRELTVQALNDTNTEDDKYQIQAEITQLQQEITRMSNQTEYNTMNIFDRHEPVYDSLLGNKNWDVDQIHQVNAPQNTLKIKLAEEYEPSEITIEVPEGTYTTYELLETIEQQLEEKAPKGTALLIEYYDGGCANLSFEGGTEIQTVEGGLSYLFYDSYGGAGVGDLIGTTQFAQEYPLVIKQGYNDELSFSIDNLDGNGAGAPISIQLEEGEYTRDEIIDAINTKLLEQGHTEVMAIAYGENNVELTAGASLITGLKGNMFQIDEGVAYDSVFYDNAKYGTITNTAGKIAGKAYYNSSCDKINIDSTNNVLRFGLEKDVDQTAGTGYTEITIPSKVGGYTITELRDVLNSQLEAISADSDWEFTSTYAYAYSGSSNYGYGNFYSLQLNSLIEGLESKIVVDMSDSVSKAAYETLFQKTTISSSTSPSTRTYGTELSYVGRPTFDSGIDLGTAGKTLSISINGGTASTITLSQAEYGSLQELLDDINAKIDANQTLKGKVTAGKVSSTDNRISLTSSDSTVTSISVKSGTAYAELFQAKVPSYRSYTSSKVYGTTSKDQGSTAITKTPAVVTLKYAMTTDNIVVDNTNNVFNLTVNNAAKSIRLSEGTYTRAGLVQEVNKQLELGGIGVTAKLTSDNKLEFSTKDSGEEYSLYIDTRSSNPATKVFMTPSTTTQNPTSSSKAPATIEGKTTIGSNFVIDSTNSNLVLTYKEKNGNTWNNTSVDISLTEKTYANANALISELNSKLEAQLGANKVVAALKNGCIALSTVGMGASYGLVPATGSAASGSLYGGSFYQEVLCKKSTDIITNTPINTAGTSVIGTAGSISNPNLSIAYVVGRADIKNETIEIKQGINDVLELDLTYPDSAQTITLTCTIPKGIYSSDADKEELLRTLEEGLNQSLEDQGITNFTIKPEIGNINTGVVGANDSNALNFKLKWNQKKTPTEGTYILDGVSGSAAYTIFYKTSGLPQPASVTGTKDISKGVSVTENNNTFGFAIDDEKYNFTIPEGDYTAEELVDVLNTLFQNGDDNGNIPKVEATIENGHLKIEYAMYGAHEITDIYGTAKDDLFFAKNSRQNKQALRLQIGANAGQELALNQIPLSLTMLKLDTIIVTKHSYAQFALKNLDYALNYINHQRSNYGAKNNRLEYAEQVAAIEAENLQASESKIRDTDIAKEATNQAKELIIVQAAQAMLAQTKDMNANAVLKLLS